MRWFSFIIILLIATLLEAGNLLNLFAVGGWYIGPSVLITLLVYFSLVCRPHEAITCCFMIGLAADLASGLMGPHMVCYGLLGVLLNSAAQMLIMKRAISKALFIFLVYLVAEIGAYWIGLLKTRQPQPDIYSISLLVGLYSAIVCPLVWSLLSALSGWSNIEKSQTHRVYH